VIHREVFAQTRSQLLRLERAFGVTVTEVDARDMDAVRNAMRSETVLIYAETPTNPLLEILDIAALADIARAADCELVVDSTFASPAVQTPLDLGATAVIHSGTKYLGGHSDVMCGVVAAREALIARLHEIQVDFGTVLDPAACWLLGRGLQTLAVRVARQSASAHRIATFLSAHELVAEVRYPWLESHESVSVARRQMRAGGGMVSFQPRGGVEAARRMLDSLKLIPIATSLGGVETVIELPYDLDFDETATEGGRAQRPALVRLSVGLEDPMELIADLDAALHASTG
jgi:cystathionine gamma-synthase